MLAPL